MKKLWALLVSNKLTLASLIAFAAAMAYATFAENDYGTAYARTQVYNAWWFEVLLAILAINFAGNIFRYRLFKRGKLGILLFHLAFILMIVGAGVSRYFGEEGLVRVREGESTHVMISERRAFSAHAQINGKPEVLQASVALTAGTPNKSYTLGEGDQQIQITLDQFIPDAVQTLTPGTPEEYVMEIVSVTESGRTSFFLENGSSVFINGHEFTMNQPKPEAINIFRAGDLYEINAGEDFNYMIMATQKQGRLSASITDTLMLRALYQSGHLNFVVNTVHEGTHLEYQTTQDKKQKQSASDLLFTTIRQAENQKQVILAAVDGVFSPLQKVQLGDQSLDISYGPQLVNLPFGLYLNDFVLERYPGSVSPSAYSSELMIIDDEHGGFQYTISMNNVLDYLGYRFFQASYDTDELGTVLSVNRDYWGTKITYLGYFLMSLGMLLSLFDKGSRFMQVSGQLKKLKQTAVVTLLLLAAPAFANDPASETSNENIPPVTSVNINLNIDPMLAQKFGELLVQDMDGRIKPINTLASEFLRKLTRKSSFTLNSGPTHQQMNANQVFLSIHQAPAVWEAIPLIKIDEEKGAPIFEVLKMEAKPFLTFNELVTPEGDYLLYDLIEAAQRKKPAERNEFDKEIIKVDERFNIFYQALSGNYLKIFPNKNSSNNSWFTSNFVHAGYSEEDSLFVSNIMRVYYNDLYNAQATGDWKPALEHLEYIRTFQNVMGQEVMPDKSRMDAEILYNKLNIYNRMFPILWMVGIAMLVLALLRQFFQNKALSVSYLIGLWLTGACFVALTLNMALRWYAGDYPPWSNGYEMIILVAWALMLFGFVFYRKSDFILPLVALFSGTLLFVSFLDWLNPEITNLVPVLKSYWLKIHVAIIVSSYAPLALSALLGLMSLIFMIFKTDKFSKSIQELTLINELSMTIGLYMLAIGTFIGGVWANESWGRYWGWDPKETWSLISIIIYAAVLHMRLIPALRGSYSFNLSSVVAFFSIIMTSFGVNYYLSGLHSYAAGDPLPIPAFVWWIIGAVVLIGSLAYWSEKQQTTKS